MGSRTQPSADRVYEDFEPFYEWNRDERLVNVMLPGYRRDQLKVQVTSKPALRLMGERPVYENRWRRFNLELPVLSDYDTDNVTAKFEVGKLSVKFGQKQTITPSQKIEQQKPTQEDIPKAKDTAEKKTNGEVSEQKTPQKEETKTETTDSTDKAGQEAKTNGLSETKEAANSETPKTKDAKSVTRSKTRQIDFTKSFGPNQVDNEVIEDLDAGKNQCKKLVKWMVLIYLVVALVGLGLYARNAWTSSPEEPYFQEL
ncbi:Inactive protein RESTRICTED TEV MOVEMENT 2 [Spatholobus suberectus]|nr:Inactive protein RESTRICTED TEV MOVEMENT 2 [Spatholobus suberectus]